MGVKGLEEAVIKIIINFDSGDDLSMWVWKEEKKNIWCFHM